MLTKQMYMLVLATMYFPINARAASSITATIAEVSSQISGMRRFAHHTVDGSGIKGDQCLAGETGMAWTTCGKLAPVDYDPFITYDLGFLCNVDSIHVWNYNSSFVDATGLWAENAAPGTVDADTNVSIIGAKDVNIYTSVDGVKFKRTGTVELSIAPGTNGYEGQSFQIHCKGIRFIKFDIKSNHDGAVFDGTGAKGGDIDGRSLTGLSEVLFMGTRMDGPAINIEPTCRATGVELDTVLSWRVGDGLFKKKIKKYELVVGIGNPANNEIMLNKTLPRKKSDKASYKLPAKLLTPDRKYWWRVD